MEPIIQWTIFRILIVLGLSSLLVTAIYAVALKIPLGEAAKDPYHVVNRRAVRRVVPFLFATGVVLMLIGGVGEIVNWVSS